VSETEGERKTETEKERNGEETERHKNLRKIRLRKVVAITTVNSQIERDCK